MVGIVLVKADTGQKFRDPNSQYVGGGGGKEDGQAVFPR